MALENPHSIGNISSNGGLSIVMLILGRVMLLIYRIFWDFSRSIWVFPKIGVPQNGWFRMENPIKMDDLEWKTLLKWMIWGYHYFWKHPFDWGSHDAKDLHRCARCEEEGRWAERRRWGVAPVADCCELSESAKKKRQHASMRREERMRHMLRCFGWKFVGWRTFHRFLWEGIQPTKRGTN